MRREGAERYLLVTLVSFAATVIITRWFLTLTGFPRIWHLLLLGAVVAYRDQLRTEPGERGPDASPAREEMNR